MDDPDLIRRAWGDPALRAIERALEAVPADEGVYFDFDNTLIRGDVGDLVMLELLETEPLAPPSSLDAWGTLTSEAHAWVVEAFDRHPHVGRDHPRRAHAVGALAAVVWHEVLPDGAAAFEPVRTSAYRGGYYAMAALLDTLEAAVRHELAERAWARAITRAPGDVARFGGHAVERFARARAPMLALYRLAERAGRAPWIVSASHEDVVRTVASALGLDPARVIGARPSRSRTLFPTQAGAPVMTYDVGKRASIAHHVEGVAPTSAHLGRARVAVAAGDSDTDHAMLEDASALMVLVDRGQPRVEALARAREDEGRVTVLRVPFELA